MKKSQNLLIRGARVYRHDGDVHQPPVADVLINDGIIRSVGENPSPDSTVEIIDARGLLLIPGFVNAHYHSYDSLAKGMFEDVPLDFWRLYTGRMGAHRSAEEVRLRTLLGAAENLRNGITTVQDMSILAPYDAAMVKVILDAYAEVGIRVVFSVSVRDISDAASIPYAREMLTVKEQGLLGNRDDDPRAIADFVAALIDKPRDLAAPLHWALSPSAPQRCSPTLLGLLRDLAIRHDLPIYTHLYESKAHALHARQHFAAHGGSLVRYLDSFGLIGPRISVAHGLWSRADELELLAKRGARLIVNVMSNFKLKDGIPPINELRRLGVPLALGCDCASCSDVQNLFQAMKWCCLLASGESAAPGRLGAADALRIATAGGAATAGLNDKLGDIQPGMKADLVLLELSDPAFTPLNSAARQIVFSETGRAVNTVIVGGKVVVKNRRVMGIDEAELAREIATLQPAYREEMARVIDGMEPLARALRPLLERINAQDVGLNRFGAH